MKELETWMMLSGMMKTFKDIRCLSTEEMVDNDMFFLEQYVAYLYHKMNTYSTVGEAR